MTSLKSTQQRGCAKALNTHVEAQSREARQSMPRTLLITSSRPGVGSVGEIFLGALCKLFQPGELFCFAAASPAYEVPVLDADLEWIPMTFRPLPEEYAWQYNEGFVEKIRRKFQHVQMLEKSLEPFVEDACRMVSQNDIQLLWLVLNSPSAVLIAEKVLERTGLPATAIVWDPISHITEQGRMDRKSQDILEASSKKVLSRIQSCGVASPAMKALFEEKQPNLPTRVLINTPVVPDRQPTVISERLIITFSGSLYAREEFLGLIAALNKMEWNLEGRQIELRVFSSAFDIPVYAGAGRARLVFGGYLSEQELLAELANSSVAYMPYWFAKEYAEGVKRCFPAKLATYVAAGCPVLYHGPKDASPTQFLAKYKVGKGVHGSDPVKFVDALKYLTLDTEFRNGYLSQREFALREEIGNDLFKARFKELVGLASGANTNF